MGDQSEVNSSTAPSSDNHRTINVDGADVTSVPGLGSGPGPGLGRQLSIYSLTLEEFQHVCEGSNKNFGSMNMDEFLNSVWTAEENQAQAQAQVPAQTQMSHYHDDLDPCTGPGHILIEKEPSLSLLRQGSLTIPAPLCSKTVDEVWLEIQKSHQQQQQQVAKRQATFGEMTLEDFLVKAGVVREQPCHHHAVPVPPLTPVVVLPTQQQHHQAHQFGFSPNPPSPSLVGRPILPYQGRGPDPKRSQKSNGGGLGAHVGLGSMMTPVSPSPVSSDGLCGPGSGGGQFGMEYGGLKSTAGRKRSVDGPVEKVVERRQRRMIKNRESAARSRARKQAYTVELEAELNHLREENAQLKEAIIDVERQRKQQYMEEKTAAERSKAQRAQEKLRSMRRIRSYDL